MSKKMKNTYIWTALAIFPALVLCAPGVVPTFFERVGVIVLCVPWLIGACMEKEKKAWRRFFIVLTCAVLLAAITYFIRMNLNGENAISGIIVTLIVANLQRLYSFILAICAAVIFWKTRKQELTIKKEKTEQKEWIDNRFAQREKVVLSNDDAIRKHLDYARVSEVENYQSMNEQSAGDSDESKLPKKNVPVRKGRTLDL